MIRFARIAGQAKYPRLWDRLKVGYAPCLIGGGDTPDMSPSRFDFSRFGTASSLSYAGSPIGVASVFAGNVSLQQSSTTVLPPAKFCTNTIDDAFTIQAYFKYTHSAGAKESTIFWSDNPTAGSAVYGYRLYVDNNTDKLKLMIANGDNMVTVFPTYYTSASTLTGGKWYHVVVVYDPYMVGDAGIGQNCLFYIDAVREFPTITNSVPSGTEEYPSHYTTTGASAQHCRIGSTLGMTSPDLSVALINIWRGNTTAGAGGAGTGADEIVDQFIFQLQANPLLMFERRRRGGGKGSRLISIGGTALRRLNVAVAG